MKTDKNIIGYTVKSYYFEISIVLLFLIYVSLCLTPSSYGIVLALFGHGGEGLLWGNYRPVRSDEWAVWTPYFQSLVNNDFQRYNIHSLYQEDFRSFNALPINDWGMIFKPLLWPFLVFEPARAYSAHHALIMVSFILGWKIFLTHLFPDRKGTLIFGLFSLLLFFSGFVQTWWTTIGPILAVTPWLFLILLWCKEVNLIKATIFSYVAVVWILSHTYPPIIISSVYLAGILIFCFHKSLINMKSILYLAAASLVALAICYVYLEDAIQIMANTVYPGQRISHGGELPWQIWLSAFVPYFTHSNYQALFSNICEISVVTSLLPIMALAFLDYSTIKNTSKTVLATFSLSLIAMSLWMLVPVPDLIAKILLLDRVPGARLLWVFGLTLQIFVLYLFLCMSIKITAVRLALFFALLTTGYVLPTFLFQIPLGDKSAWELLAIPALILIALVIKTTTNNEIKTVALLFTALCINLIYFGAFNPGQSARPIFSLKDSAAIEPLKLQQQEDSRGWLVIEGYPGAVLHGLGLNAVTHVLVAPQLTFFKEFFPDLDPATFNDIFNRYAHIHLTNEAHPYYPQPDVVSVPKSIFGGDRGEANEAKFLLRDKSIEYFPGGYIDHVEITDHHLILTGWRLTTEPSPIFLMDEINGLTGNVEKLRRPDVASALENSQLIFSGFRLNIDADKQEAEQLIDKLCLYTSDTLYGVRQIQAGNPESLYQCGVISDD